MSAKSRIRWAMWAAPVLLATALVIAIGAAGWAEDRSSDDAALKQVVAAISAGWNNHDARAMCASLAEEIEWYSWNGGVLHGKQAVENQHRGLFADTYKNVHRTDTVKNIQYLGPDLASVDDYWTMTGAKYRGGREWPYREGYVNSLMARRDGRWVVIVSHTADFNATAPGAAAH